ncbi:macro domain-containing protein [Streptomyces roseochromogenus]|uniref:Regulatory protein n=1 Tax=Streptomyces roseochromogenus subsp. oscitans DS 12.976 TaxID=1352936 RepID=V6KJF0_STRRC|nr:macro domain-containing protein [Streptomyces roseochromogenus]EST32305.1 regulatory protein [Streptomyces roseochromogenus subsp. oscitans DS 12.976]
MQIGIPRVRVSVLGPVRLDVNGTPVRLTPLTARLLVRLVAADGEAVTARRLYRDVWQQTVELPRQEPRNRNEVQKRILELRRAFDLAGPGYGARIIRTGQLPSARGAQSTYQLDLSDDELDSAEFTRLVGDALHAAPASAVRLLADALRLWRGRPLTEVHDEDFALAPVRRLTRLRETARRELINGHTALARYDLALPVAEQTVRERPDDPEAAAVLARLNARLRERHGDELLRHTLRGLRVDVVVVRGDLFDQEDANLVVGFSDTFDTFADDVVISRESVQGQLVDRLFQGRHRLLDDKLRRGLGAFTPLGRESVHTKRRGRRTRFPIGTVVAVPVGRRRVFAMAYSRLGNDLRARSGPADLRLSLERLWPSVARHGLFKPVAIPLIGAGLSRIVELDRTQLVLLIVETFTESLRQDPAACPELRVVIRADELERTDLSAVEAYLRGVDVRSPAFPPAKVR